MDTKKMALTGTGLIATGIGLSAIGAVLVVPALVEFAMDVAEKAGGRFATEAERASRTVGTVAGTLQKSFIEAARAGVSEFRKAASAREPAA